MTRKSRLSLVAFSLWLAAGIVHAAEGGGAGSANQLDRFLQGLHTFSARFEQRLLDDNNEELDKSAGMMYLERPGKFYWHYSRPYSQYLISDGHSLWVYDEDLEQVTVKDIGESLEESPAAILGGDVEVERYYIVTDLGLADGVDTMQLTPRSGNSQYQSIRLGFREGQLVTMTLLDSLGQKTEIRFLDAKRNFQPPQGVDVIDGRHG
jgi:outer membrane lipoprotein carrier protein